MSFPTVQARFIDAVKFGLLFAQAGKDQRSPAVILSELEECLELIDRAHDAAKRFPTGAQPECEAMRFLEAHWGGEPALSDAEDGLDQHWWLEPN